MKNVDFIDILLLVAFFAALHLAFKKENVKTFMIAEDQDQNTDAIQPDEIEVKIEL